MDNEETRGLIYDFAIFFLKAAMVVALAAIAWLLLQPHPEHPITLPHPEHPIYYPDNEPHPEHPIYIPGDEAPAHPIVIPPGEPAQLPAYLKCEWQAGLPPPEPAPAPQPQ
jgi:hypothetical protein